MTQLNITPNLASPDDFYATLIASHEGMTKEQSDALNASLVLLLANHIGDQTVIEQAIELAKKTV